jgi:hypothetical protein
LPANPPSAWPAPFSNQPAPRAELITAPPGRPLAPLAPKPPRRAYRWILVVLVVAAVSGVFKRATHNPDVAAAMRKAEAFSKKAQEATQEAVETPAVPPAAEVAVDSTRRELKKGLDEAKRALREAFKDDKDDDGDEDDEKDAPEPPAPPLVKAPKAKAAKSAAEPLQPAPPEVAGLLASAEAALAAEDPKLALHLADQSFFAKKTSAGWAVKARAYCQLKDLGNARAALGNVTPKAAKAKVVADCKEHGVDLR